MAESDLNRDSVPTPEVSDNTARAGESAGKKQRTRRIPPLLIVIPLAALLTVAVILIIYFTTRDGTDEVRATLYANGLLAVEIEVNENGESVTRWGYVGKDGSFVIEAKFLAADSFADNGLAAVKTRDGWGYINKNGELVIAAQYKDAGAFGEYNYAAVKLGDSWGYIRKDGTPVVNPQFDMAYSFTDKGLALVKIGEKYGYINRAGAYVIVPRFEDARSFRADGTAQVKEFGKWGVINTKGEYTINPQFDEISTVSSCGLTRVMTDGKYGYIEKSGVYAINPTYTFAKDFAANGLALVEKDGEYGFINKKNELVLSGFAGADSFGAGGLAPIQEKKGGAWEYVDRTGKVVFENIFVEANAYSFGLALVKDRDGKWLFLNEKGQGIITCPENCRQALPFYEDGFTFLITADAESEMLYYTLINKKGEVLLDRIVNFRY